VTTSVDVLTILDRIVRRIADEARDDRRRSREPRDRGPLASCSR
jgi:hypothetical protein